MREFVVERASDRTHRPIALNVNYPVIFIRQIFKRLGEGVNLRVSESVLRLFAWQQSCEKSPLLVLPQLFFGPDLRREVAGLIRRHIQSSEPTGTFIDAVVRAMYPEMGLFVPVNDMLPRMVL
jgi:hypothetical protein